MRRTWSGRVTVAEDLRVPPGTELTILAGTTVVFDEAPSTKTDPPFWQAGTELAVAGRLDVLGTPDQPVVFEGVGSWGGIVAEPGAQVSLVHTEVRARAPSISSRNRAETGFT